MNQEIRDFIERSDYYRGSVRELAGMLPPEDEALDRLIGETVAASDQNAFAFIVMAALHAGRPVQARHLARGIILMPEKITLGTFACHVQGDITGPLTDALTNLNLPSTEFISTALFLAATWHQEHGGGKLPGPLVSAARKAARNKSNSEYDRSLIHLVALMSADAGLIAISLETCGVKPDDPTMKVRVDASKATAEQMLKIWRRPPFELLPEAPRKLLATGNTMRRAVARIGRNEPCPCGSGKKYKHCCNGKDQERLHHSTSIAGMTEADLRANPERYLTVADLNHYPAHEVARFDPLKIAPELQDGYLANLCRARLFEAAVTGFEKFGYRDKLKEAWEAITIRVAQARHKDLVERMLKLLPEGHKHRLGAVEFFLADTDPATLMTSLKEGALTMLSNDGDDLRGFSTTLMKSPLCGLGILVARGAISVLPQAAASEVLEELLRTRDQMGLPPDDPISDVLDMRFLEEHPDEGKDAAALREAQERLNAKVEEVQRYKQSVAQLQKEVARREQLAATAAPAAPAAATVVADEQALKELRDKVETLKSALKERHHERNTLRRELQQAHTDLETLRQTAAPVEAEAPDREEELLLPQDAPEVHPVRVIEFPKGFQQMLAEFPRQVARAAMVMIGRLAAGEPAAFVGALRLKATPNVMRQRIGSDYRLLFRLHPDRLEVIDLINRKDLDRRIKTLV